MSTTQILKLIEELPVNEKLQIAEAILHSILKEREIKEKEEKELESVAEDLLEEYQTDKELTIFTELDIVDFYEEG
jgi:hypothetical protein